MKRLWHLVVIALVAVLGAFASPGVAGSGDGVTYVASDYSAAWPPPAATPSRFLPPAHIGYLQGVSAGDHVYGGSLLMASYVYALSGPDRQDFP